VFSDGTTLNLAAGAPITGSPTLAGPPTLEGGPGNDTLIGTTGNQTFIGNGGNDTYIGGSSSNDVFLFAVGNQTAYGGSGNDYYSYAAGDGSATISDSGGTDTLAFGSGIADNQLWFAQNGNNLVISVIGTNSEVTIQGWYSASANQIETIKTTSGDTLKNSQVANLVSAMSSLAPPPLGQTTLTSTEATTLDPVIAANWT